MTARPTERTKFQECAGCSHLLRPPSAFGPAFSSPQIIVCHQRSQRAYEGASHTVRSIPPPATACRQTTPPTLLAEFAVCQLFPSHRTPSQPSSLNRAQFGALCCLCLADRQRRCKWSPAPSPEVPQGLCPAEYHDSWSE